MLIPIRYWRLRTLLGFSCALGVGAAIWLGLWLVFGMAQPIDGILEAVFSIWGGTYVAAAIERWRWRRKSEKLTTAFAEHAPEALRYGPNTPQVNRLMLLFDTAPLSILDETLSDARKRQPRIDLVLEDAVHAAIRGGLTVGEGTARAIFSSRAMKEANQAVEIRSRREDPEASEDVHEARQATAGLTACALALRPFLVPEQWLGFWSLFEDHLPLAALESESETPAGPGTIPGCS